MARAEAAGYSVSEVGKQRETNVGVQGAERNKCCGRVRGLAFSVLPRRTAHRMMAHI